MMLTVNPNVITTAALLLILIFLLIYTVRLMRRNGQLLRRNEELLRRSMQLERALTSDVFNKKPMIVPLSNKTIRKRTTQKES